MGTKLYSLTAQNLYVERSFNGLYQSTRKSPSFVFVTPRNEDRTFFNISGSTWDGSVRGTDRGKSPAQLRPFLSYPNTATNAQRY